MNKESQDVKDKICIKVLAKYNLSEGKTNMVDLNLLQSSNAWKHIGMEIIRNNDGKLGVKVKASENLKQVYGNIHGGIIAMAVDSASGVAINDLIGIHRGAVTVELKVNYLNPAGDSDIYAFAQVVKKGKRIITCTVEVFNSKGDHVAVGITTFMLTQND